jgi:energy-coupling factor transporter ATP-binding protein EcfA2
VMSGKTLSAVTTCSQVRVNPQEEVLRALRLFHGDGAVVELRALGAGHRVVAGFFDDYEKLAAAAADLDRSGAHVYVTVNAVNPALLARCANRVRPAGDGMPLTSDGDVVRRRWLLLDLDPVRPAGVAATEDEHRAALRRAKEIRRWLAEQGWPEPVVVDSGNGAYVLYRVDLGNTPEATDLIRRVLAAVDLHFTDGTVAVDTKTFNAGRIVRLPGSLNRKGDSTPDRPHRRCRILQVPDRVQVVKVEQLQRVAVLGPATPRVEGSPSTGDPKDRVERVLEALGLEVVRAGPWGAGGWKWILRACPWQPELHCDRSAYVVVLPSGAIAAGCHHNSCAGRGWRDLLGLLPPGERPQLKPVAAKAPVLLTAAEILDEADAPGPKWVVDGLVPSAGVVLLVGRPKSGKSTLARALAVAVAQGREFLGRQVLPGPVVLVSLEDRKHDVARHLRALGLRPGDPLMVATELGDPKLLRGWVQEHRPALVIVDTVGRVLGLQDSSAYAEVLAALEEFLRLARESGSAMLLLHHAPKGSDSRDVIDAPLGSTAFAGTADVVLHLKRGRDGVRTLASAQRVGEDLEESVVVVGSDGWPALGGTRRDVQAGSLKRALLEALRIRGEATTQELLDDVEGEWGAKLRALQAMVDEGLVLREGTGRRGDPYRYCLPEPGFIAALRGQCRATKGNQPQPASDLAESVAQNRGVPQRIRQSGATNPPLLRGPEIRMVRDPLACRRGLQRIVRVRGK